MNNKERLNHRKYIQILRQMTPEERLLKAFELSEFGKQLFIHGLRKQFPDLPEEESMKLYIKHLIQKSEEERAIWNTGQED